MVLRACNTHWVREWVKVIRGRSDAIAILRQAKHDPEMQKALVAAELLRMANR